MLKLLLLLFSLSWTIVVTAQDTNYQAFYNSIYAIEIKIQNTSELKAALVENGLKDKKWLQYVLNMNGLKMEELDQLKTSKTLFLPKLDPSVENEPELNRENKPICSLMNPRELEKQFQLKGIYRNYHDYIYSRKAKMLGTVKNTLNSDKFYYPNLKRWVKITKDINLQKNFDNQEIFLPPCVPSITTIAKELPKAASVIIAPQTVTKKTTPRKKIYSYFANTSLGQVTVQSDDSIKSQFQLTFLKIGLGVQRSMDQYSLRAGLALNNYLSIKFKSDEGSGSTNKINSYYDLFIGGSKNFGNSRVTLQYDNLNYLLNKKNQTAINLGPVRVDRISILEAYRLNERYLLLAGLGYFPSLFSYANGLEGSIGAGYAYDKRLTFLGNIILNKLSKGGMNNESKVFVIGANYNF
jgi:hypothetical protein